jgi:hypothetical protein
MRRFDQLFLSVVGTVFLGLGTINLFFPAAGMAGFELRITSVSALNEMRANYGGMHFALGLLFLSGAFLEALRVSALLVVAVFTGGLVLGRSLSLALDGAPNHLVLGLFALEALGCVVATVLYRRASRATTRPGNA